MDEEPNLNEDKLFHLGTGLIFRAVCAPKNWEASKVQEEVTRVDPPGTSLNEWIISTDVEDREDEFTSNPIQCPDCKDRRHWLLNC